MILKLIPDKVLRRCLVELHYEQFSQLYESSEINFPWNWKGGSFLDINIAIWLAAFEGLMERDQEELHFHKPKVDRGAQLGPK